MHKYQIFNILVIYFTNVSRGTLGGDVKSMISLKRGYSCQAERSRSPITKTVIIIFYNTTKHCYNYIVFYCKNIF
ncbi:hypothetical protein DKB58_07770 [Capnocytophaga canimorsus]|nr:hypothetical protein DKB58_07770 [Capnocytophaga canimorsus]